MVLPLYVAVSGICITGLLLWFLADLKHSLKWGRCLAELQLRDENDAITRHFRKELRSYRPMLLLFRAFVVPGILEAEYAMHLSNIGRQEEALQWASRAVRKARWKNKDQSIKLRVRGLIYYRSGRYSEAQADAANARVQSESSEITRSDDLEGLILLYTGRL